MLRNQRPLRISRVKGFAFIAILLALLTTITTFGAGGSHLAFIDSATEFFGLHSKIAPVFSNEQTFATVSEPQAALLTSTHVFAVSLSLPDVTATPGDITVPITISDMTGEGVFAYDLQITFDPAVVQPTGVGFDATGTLSSEPAWHPAQAFRDT